MGDYKTLPVTSEVLSLSEQHLEGVAGAHRIIMQVTADHHHLDASTNNLGTRGTEILLDGLDKVRRRFSVMPPAPRARTPSPNRYRMMNDAPKVSLVKEVNGRKKGELWGMRSVNLARNRMEDYGLLAAANYAKKDLWMRDLFLQDNLITLADVVDDVVERINASLLVKLSITANPLDATGVARFFDLLDAPKLRELRMSNCGIPASCAQSIASFLCSPRSQRMDKLELNINQLTRLGVTKILDAMELGNFTIQWIGLNGNGPAPARVQGEDEGPGYFPPEDDDDGGESDESLSKDDPRSMSWQIMRRLPAIQKRNSKLTRRVQNAAARALAPTRIIVHALPPSEIDDTTRRLEDATVGDAEPEPARKPYFPFLELPVEVQFLIARHASGDAEALSDSQWARVLKHASDRSTLSNLAERTSRAQARVATHGHTSHDVKKYKTREVRDEWLAEMRCEWWELENQRYWDELRNRAAT